MAQRNYSSPNPTRSRNTLRAFLLIVALSLISIIIYKKFVSPPGYSNIPKELQLNYVPSDYQININEEDALAILSNPHRYRKEFNNLVYDINMSILYHVANRMNLSAEDKGKLQGEYEKHHPYLRNLYFHDFVALKDTTSQLYQTWYDNEGSNAIDVLREVASKYTCFLINQLLATALETTDGKISVAGRNVDTPCGVALTEALQPMIKRLEDRAAIQDFSRSKGFLEQKIERVTAQLATMEVRDKKGLNKQMQTKLWGFNVSSSELEVTAVSVLKVGFDLHKYFEINIDGNRKTVVVTLPEPEILSHEVYPRIDKLDIGWMREVEDADFNKNFNLLRKEFRREALESDIMDKAKTQAQELMQTMLGPLISKIGRDYKLQVAFHNTNPGILDDFEEGTLGS